jgi:hypothetical protein
MGKRLELVRTCIAFTNARASLNDRGLGLRDASQRKRSMHNARCDLDPDFNLCIYSLSILQYTER